MGKSLGQAGQDAYNNFVNKINDGDWNGAGKDAGHAAVAVAQIASIVVGGIGAIKGLASLPSFLRNLPNLLKGGRGAGAAFPAALAVGNNARTGISVYKGLSSAGEWVYSGITNSILRRAMEHLGRFDIREVGKGLTWGQARAIEQALININKARKATVPPANVINSISPIHAYYDAAVKWGEWWLRSNKVNIR
jgi:hypothetical protein